VIPGLGLATLGYKYGLPGAGHKNNLREKTTD